MDISPIIKVFQIMSEQSNFVYIVLNTRQIQNNYDDLDVFVMSKATYISQIIKVF